MATAKEKADLVQCPGERNSNNPTPQAMAVEIDPIHQPPIVQVVYQSSAAHPAVRYNRDVECCYPISTADPVEMAGARNVAIVQVCMETMALFFCRSGWCVFAALFAIPSSSSVACCCKKRGCYTLWSTFGCLAFFLHAAAAATEVLGRDEYYDGNPSAFIFMVQIALCLISLLVVRHGIKLASLLREPVFPVEGGVGGMDVTPQAIFQPNQVQYTQASLSP